MIHKKNISNSSLLLSQFVLGMWHVDTLSDVQLDTLLRTAIDAGITSIDNADIYGAYQCEEKFGKWMGKNKGERNQLELVTKCGIKLLSKSRPTHRVGHYDTTKTYIIASAETSLKKMQTDYLDLLLIHRPDPLMHPDEIAAAFDTLVKSGKVKHVGVSNFTPSQFSMVQAACEMPLVTNQLEISLAYNDYMFDGTLDYLLEHKITPMAWSPLGGASHVKEMVNKKTVKEIAAKYDIEPGNLLLSWLLEHPAGIVPVLGTMNPERVTSSHTALDVAWDRQDWYILLEESRGMPVP